MNASLPRLQLPIRLLPRKRVYVLLSAFFGFFFVFSAFWIIAAAQPGMRLEFNDEGVTDPRMRRLFPFFGVPFFLIGAGGLAVFGARLLSRSPYYHVEVSLEGLRLRDFGRPRDFAWRDLPPFQTLEVVTSDSDGTTRNYYAIAMREKAPITPAKGKVDPREIVRVAADEYGVKDTMADAQMLADWLNQVREHGLARCSDGIDLPPFLRKIAIPAPVAAQPTRRTRTVLRR